MASALGLADGMRIIISGGIETGKTTVCYQVVQMAQRDGMVCGGILTPCSDDGGKWLEDIASGARVLLATRSSVAQGLTVGRYSIDKRSIEFGKSAIRAARNADVLVIDELGALELKGEGFAEALDLVNQGRVRNVIMVIRSKYLARFQRLLKQETTVFEVTAANRERIAEKVYLLLR